MFHYFSISSYLQVFIRILSKGYLVQIKEWLSRMSKFLFLSLLDQFSQAVSSASFSLEWQTMRYSSSWGRFWYSSFSSTFSSPGRQCLAYKDVFYLSQVKRRGGLSRVLRELCLACQKSHSVWTCLSVDSSEVGFYVVWGSNEPDVERELVKR